METNWNQDLKPELDKDISDAQTALDNAKRAAARDWAVAKDDLNKALDQLQSAYDKASAPTKTSGAARPAPKP
jgi:hypothetical protein